MACCRCAGITSVLPLLGFSGEFFLEIAEEQRKARGKQRTQWVTLSWKVLELVARLWRQADTPQQRGNCEHLDAGHPQETHAVPAEQGNAEREYKGTQADPDKQKKH